MDEIMDLEEDKESHRTRLKLTYSNMLILLFMTESIVTTVKLLFTHNPWWSPKCMGY